MPLSSIPFGSPQHKDTVLQLFSNQQFVCHRCPLIILSEILRLQSLQSNLVIRLRMVFTIEEFLPVFKGLRNGLEYGSRVRFVHSLMMTFLYKSFNKKTIKSIFKNAWEHGKKLGIFVFFYKLCCLLLKKAIGQRPLNSFFSGFVVGGLVFGKKTPINYQINLYLLSRITIALAEMLYKKYVTAEEGQQQDEQRTMSAKKLSFRVLAGIVWGLVMWLFLVQKEVLQESLRSSMQHLYIESEHQVKNWFQFLPYSQNK